MQWCIVVSDSSHCVVLFKTVRGVVSCHSPRFGILTIVKVS